MEERNFIILLIISENYATKLRIIIKFVIKLFEMRDVILIGSGNVATRLGIALKQCNYQIIQVYSRSIENASILGKKLNADFTNDLIELKTADLIIVSVHDDAITNITTKLKNIPIVHTSGSVGLNVFNNTHKNCGVFYPLQTFDKEIELDFSVIPICIEANNHAFEQELISLAKNLSNTVVRLNSEQRKQLHIAAVFACNFSNQMFAIADEILAKNNIDFKLLLPLINQTVSKLNNNKAKDVQTGPAQRKDIAIINEHLKALETTDVHELYALITQYIMDKKNYCSSQ